MHKPEIQMLYKKKTVNDIDVYIDFVARIFESLGVLTIVIGTSIALTRFFLNTRSYKILRQELGKAILLGLEILVAGDIIATVVTEPSMDRVLALGVIVLIRTFLSLSIQVEIEGKFPWKKENEV
jgi:uncharacterized membrane protein